ncbi:MAG: membrane protein insertase YidC, partial [Chthoniobacterales bacterium]|nr:membrane protein insertase YidC [Chthoniobacterales bacterium]
MDRTAWIAVTLCVIALVGWQFYMTSHAPHVLPAPSPTPAAEFAQASPASSAASPVAAPAVTPAAPAPADEIQPFEEQIETLRNGDIELRLTNRGGGISEAHLLNHKAENGQGDIVLNSASRLPIGAIIEDPAAPALPQFTMARQPDGSVQFERAAGGVTIRKRFILPADTQKKDNYVSEMQIEFRNDGAEPYRSAGYFLALGSAAPIHPRDMSAYTRMVWCIDGKAKATDVNWFAAQHYPLVGVEKRPAQQFFREKVVPPAEWAGVSNQFFTALLTPLNAKASDVWAQRFEVKPDEATTLLGIEGAMGLPGFDLQPGQSNTVDLQVYTGPKLYGRLAKLQHDEAEIMNFGIWKLVSQTLLNFMNLIHRYLGNYGFSIILLTACVKAVLWPLQNKANRSMRKMSALAPKMQELKLKYKDDPTRMNQEVMKLYKDHGVNPVGGCLPMMIQIPIFFGLFSMLGQAAELRNASFLWVRDLAQPDTIAHLPGIGWPINILPLIMGASNVWLMRMTPKTGDTTQQRVMMFMPLIFLFFCYNFAAALALYYTTQNLFTILQLWHNQRQPAPVLEVAPTPKRSRKGAR